MAELYLLGAAQELQPAVRPEHTGGLQADRATAPGAAARVHEREAGGPAVPARRSIHGRGYVPVRGGQLVAPDEHRPVVVHESAAIPGTRCPASGRAVGDACGGPAQVLSARGRRRAAALTPRRQRMTPRVASLEIQKN